MPGFSYLLLSVIWQSARPMGNLSFFFSVFLQFLEPQCLESPGSFVKICYRKREDRKMWRKKRAPRSILEKKISAALHIRLCLMCQAEWPAPHSGWGHFQPQAAVWLPVPGPRFWGGLLSQSVHIAHGSACPVLQWEPGQQNGTGAIPAPGSLHARVLSLAQLQLPGQGQGWWPCLSWPYRPAIHLQVTTYR